MIFVNHPRVPVSWKYYLLDIWTLITLHTKKPISSLFSYKLGKSFHTLFKNVHKVVLKDTFHMSLFCWIFRLYTRCNWEWFCPDLFNFERVETFRAYTRERLGIFPSPKAYIEQNSSEFFQVPEPILEFLKSQQQGLFLQLSHIFLHFYTYFFTFLHIFHPFLYISHIFLHIPERGEGLANPRFTSG